MDDLYATHSQVELVEVMPQILLPLIDLSAILTAGWYTELAPDVSFRVSDDQTAVSEGRINYTTVWTFQQNGLEEPVDRMIGAFQRMIFDASRQVVIGNAKAEGVPWHRDARQEACSFCRLLTVNPHAYNGKYVDMPSHNHDCQCIAVVSRADNPYTPPDYVEQWRQEVNREKTGELTSTLAGMDDSNV